MPVVLLLAALQVTAQVVSVVDGDTLKVEAQIWPGLVWQGSVRLAGVDTPELKGRCPEERELAAEARRFVQEQIGETVTLVDVQKGKYAGRVVARVRLADGRGLAKALIEAGHGRPYTGGGRESWCNGRR